MEYTTNDVMKLFKNAGVNHPSEQKILATQAICNIMSDNSKVWIRETRSKVITIREILSEVNKNEKIKFVITQSVFADTMNLLEINRMIIYNKERVHSEERIYQNMYDPSIEDEWIPTYMIFIDKDSPVRTWWLRTVQNPTELAESSLLYDRHIKKIGNIVNSLPTTMIENLTKKGSPHIPDLPMLRYTLFDQRVTSVNTFGTFIFDELIKLLILGETLQAANDIKNTKKKLASSSPKECTELGEFINNFMGFLMPSINFKMVDQMVMKVELDRLNNMSGTIVSASMLKHRENIPDNTNTNEQKTEHQDESTKSPEVGNRDTVDTNPRVYSFEDMGELYSDLFPGINKTFFVRNERTRLDNHIAITAQVANMLSKYYDTWQTCGYVYRSVQDGSLLYILGEVSAELNRSIEMDEILNAITLLERLGMVVIDSNQIPWDYLTGSSLHSAMEKYATVRIPNWMAFFDDDDPFRKRIFAYKKRLSTIVDHQEALNICSDGMLDIWDSYEVRPLADSLKHDWMLKNNLATKEQMIQSVREIVFHNRNASGNYVTDITLKMLVELIFLSDMMDHITHK